MFPTSQSEAPLQTKVSDLPSSLSPRLIRFKHIIVALLLSVVFFCSFVSLPYTVILPGYYPTRP